MTVGSATWASTPPVPESDTPTATSDPEHWQARLETFVGREREMQILRARIDDAMEGKGSLVLVSGEPGIGKTRLLTEAARYAEERSAKVMWGNGWEGDSAPTFWPWAGVLRTFISCDWIPQEHREDIESLLPAPPPNSEPAIVTKYWKDDARFRTFTVVASLIDKMAASTAVLLVLDDLHWVDDSSLQLLDLVVRSKSANVAIFVAYRQNEIIADSQLARFVANASRGGSTHQVQLSGLDGSCILGLIPSDLPLRNSLAASLMRQTDGNPLLLTEMLRHFHHTPRAFESDFTLQQIPHTLRGLVDLRLADLCPAAVEVLHVAAVIGPTFSLQILSAVANQIEKSDLQEQLEIAQRLSLVVQLLDDEFAFKHALMRDVLYHRIAPDRRSELHRAIAGVLETRLNGSYDQVLPQIAYHYFASSLPDVRDEALCYNEAAADQAVKHLAYEKAIPFLRNLLSLLNGDDLAQSARHCETLVSLGDVQLLSGRWSDARETFRRAADISRLLKLPRLFGRAAIGFRGTRGSSLPPDMEAIKLLREAINIEPEALGADTHAILLSHLAITLYSTSEEDRTCASEAALAAAATAESDATTALAWFARAHSLSSPDRLDEVEEITDKLLPISRSVGSAELVFRTSLLRYMCHLFNFDSRAEYELVRCNKIATELANPTFLWQASSLKVGRAIACGELDEAIRLALHTKELGSQVHDLTSEQYFAGHQFWIAILTGKGEHARPAIARILEHAPEVTILRAGLAYIDSQTGKHDRALGGLEVFRRERFQSIPNDVFKLFTLALLAEVAYHEGDRISAEMISSQLKAFRGKNVVFSWGALFAGNVSYFLGLLRLLAGGAVDSEHLFREAISSDARLGSTALVARTRLALSQALLAQGACRQEEADHEHQTALREYQAMGLLPPHALIGELPSGHATERVKTVVADAHATFGEPSGEPSTAKNQTANRIARGGDYWSISYRGQTVRLRGVRGLEYISQLIQHQGQDVPAILLAQSGGISSRNAPPIEDGLAEPSWQSDKDVDQIATLEYAARVRSLSEQLVTAREDNDLGTVRAIEAEIEWIRSQLTQCRRPRATLLGVQLERARVSVRNNISSTLKRIYRYHQDLGRHLDHSIRTGRLCSYKPEQYTLWQID